MNWEKENSTFRHIVSKLGRWPILSEAFCQVVFSKSGWLVLFQIRNIHLFNSHIISTYLFDILMRIELITTTIYTSIENLTKKLKKIVIIRVQSLEKIKKYLYLKTSCLFVLFYFVCLFVMLISLGSSIPRSHSWFHGKALGM